MITPGTNDVRQKKIKSREMRDSCVLPLGNYASSSQEEIDKKMKKEKKKKGEADNVEYADVIHPSTRITKQTRDKRAGGR